MIKAVFFDIDGTLVSFQTQQVPESTRKSIEELRRKGIKVFIATGRHFVSMPDFGGLQFDGYVTINGGLCLSGDGTPIYKHPIAPADFETVLEVERKDPFPCLVMNTEGLYLNYINEEVEEGMKMNLFPTMQIRPLEELAQTDIFQLVSFISEEREKELLTLLPDCHSLRWHPLFTDFVPKGSHKGVGIDQLLAYHHISLEETMAFGDGGNDISMLQHVGVGIAMGNAADEVKAHADYVAQTVDDDGIYYALKKFNLID